MDETGRHAHPQDMGHRIAGWMLVAGFLLGAWGVLGVALAPDGAGNAPGVAYLAAVVGAMLLVGGLVLRGLRP